MNAAKTGSMQTSVYPYIRHFGAGNQRCIEWHRRTENAPSICIGTNFEFMIRNAEINTLIFAGISTEFGVESSGRDASNRGYFTVIAKDAVSSHSKEGHERSLLNMENMLCLMTTEEILRMWNC